MDPFDFRVQLSRSNLFNLLATVEGAVFVSLGQLQ